VASREELAGERPESRTSSMRRRIAIALAIMGPGLLTGIVDNDPTGIAGYSLAGAHFGYTMLWALLLSTVSLAVIQEMVARMGAVTGKGLADLIRERFGVRMTLLAMLTLLVANTATTIAEFAGVAGASEIFGVSRYLSVPLAAVAVFVLITLGSYRRVEVLLLIVSLIFAATMLYRRRDVKRFFAYSSIEHMGIIAFAFGLGGPLANFAGLLHMTMHSLAKSGIFFTIGHITRIKGSQRIADIRGLTESHPGLGWLLVASVAAIAGLPPFGVFTSEFLVVSSTFARQPLLAAPLVLGLLISVGALFLRINSLAFGEPTGSLAPTRMTKVPMLMHLGLVLTAGVFLPSPLAAWFQHVAHQLG